MASSNRHWPSMFKSKPCSNQWQHDINQSLLSSGCHRSTYSSPGCEERSPEPKPRWNPRPEQIRILEAIFNSGMVNPPREEIRKIRAQLQEYGQVGDANVFYWFQNRKSRSKHKLHHHHHKNHNHLSKPKPSTSSDKPSPPEQPSVVAANDDNGNRLVVTSSDQVFVDDVEHYDPVLLGFGAHPLGLYVNNNNALGEIMTHHHHGGGGSDEKSDGTDDHDRHNHHKALVASDDDVVVVSAAVDPISPLNIAHHHHHLQGGGGGGCDGEEGCGGGSMVVGPAGKSTVFINDVAFEVPVGPFNVREAFGDDAVLINSYGHPVLTNQWGLTLHSLTHGSFYYLI